MNRQRMRCASALSVWSFCQTDTQKRNEGSVSDATNGSMRLVLLCWQFICVRTVTLTMTGIRLHSLCIWQNLNYVESFRYIHVAFGIELNWKQSLLRMKYLLFVICYVHVGLHFLSVSLGPWLTTCVFVFYLFSFVVPVFFLMHWH